MRLFPREVQEMQMQPRPEGGEGEATGPSIFPSTDSCKQVRTHLCTCVPCFVPSWVSRLRYLGGSLDWKAASAMPAAA